MGVFASRPQPVGLSIMKRLSSLARASLLIAFFFALDKGLAFLRSLLFNKIVGLEGMGIFGAANNIPDYLSALISGGALGMAFIPVLTEYLDREGRAAAWDLFSRIVNLAFGVTAAISLIIILSAEPLVRYVIAPGFTPARQALTAELMRLDLIAILLFSISGLVMAGLQAHKHFLLPAMAPVLYNLGQIFGVLILSPEEGLQVGRITLPAYGLGLHGMVYGVIMGAALHLLVQVPGLLRYGYRWTAAIDPRHPGVQQVLLLLWPRVLTMACIQLYFVARDNLASHFGEVGVGALNLGWTIQQVPETMIGTAIAIALLPSLSEFVHRQQQQEFTVTVNRALRVMLALGLPCAVLLALGVRPLSAAFFRYPATQLDMLTACSWGFLLGLVGDTWLEVAVRSFYANQDTRTPLVAAALQAVTFIALASLLSSTKLGVAGIALAASLSFTCQAIGLLVRLQRGYPGILHLGASLRNAVLSAAAAFLTGYAILLWLGHSPIYVLLAWLAGGGLAALFVRKELYALLHL